jgi:uncharacterized phage protein (TIGR02220 family)
LESNGAVTNITSNYGRLKAGYRNTGEGVTTSSDILRKGIRGGGKMFGKVPELIWRDIKFIRLSETTKLIYLYLLTNKHRTLLGMYYLPLSYIETDTGVAKSNLGKVFKELDSINYAYYDDECGVVLLPNYLELNNHYNWKHLRGGLAALSGVRFGKLASVMIEIMDNELAKTSNKEKISAFNDIKAYLVETQENILHPERQSIASCLPLSISISKSISISNKGGVGGKKEGEEESEELELFQQDSSDKVKSDKEEFQELIDYLNELSGKRYRLTDQILVSMRARRKEGFTYEDMKKAIDNQVANLKGTDKEHYMHPRTIFRNASNLDGYINMTIKKKSGRLGNTKISDTDPLNQ